MYSINKLNNPLKTVTATLKAIGSLVMLWRKTHVPKNAMIVRKSKVGALKKTTGNKNN